MVVTVKYLTSALDMEEMTMPAYNNNDYYALEAFADYIGF